MIGGPLLGAIATLVSLQVEMIVAALFLVPALYLYSRYSTMSEPAVAEMPVTN